MKEDEIDRLIRVISWGKILVDDTPTPLILDLPTSEDSAIAALIYEKAYKEATDESMSTEEEAIAYHIITGNWDIKTDKEIAGIQEDIKTITRGLLDFLFNKTKLEAARKTLRSAEKALLERIMKRNSLLEHTAEQYAMLKRQRYIISKITRTTDGNLFWPSDEAFNAFTNLKFIDHLCDIFFYESRLSQAAIREIARSKTWRLNWMSAKTAGHLFDGNPAEWSFNQKELVGWSNTYDMVHEAYERPSADIIEDDDLLDSWMMREGEKIENRTKKEIGEKLVAPSSKDGRQECFIVTDREGAKDVYAMNDRITRAKIKAKEKLIAKKGTVKEQNLPESQAEIRQKAMQEARQTMKDISRR
jgi:hypothetical protein